MNNVKGIGLKNLKKKNHSDAEIGSAKRASQNTRTSPKSAPNQTRMLFKILLFFPLFFHLKITVTKRS